MKHSRERHGRHTIRLKDYDYSQEGAYFITICIQNRQCLFGDIKDGNMFLNQAGEMVRSVWENLPRRFVHVISDEYIVMPNHIHGVIIIDRRGESCIRPNYSMGDHKDRPYGTATNSIGCIIQAYKSVTTNRYILDVRNTIGLRLLVDCGNAIITNISSVMKKIYMKFVNILQIIQ